MGFFTYNYFKNLNRPEVYLAYPDKRTIGALHTYNLQTDIMANSSNKGNFTVYRYEDGEETRFYDKIEIGKYVHLYGIGWFRINEISIVNEGINEYKEVSILSIECELGQTYLTSFGSLGTDDDEQGGLDRYCLYNPLDAEHSIMHIVLQKNPGWSIRYIDSKISKEYRSFQEDSVDTYSFLTGKVSETYECIFLFDSYERSISAYKLENLGKDTGITLNYRNVIKSIKMDSTEDDVKTVLTVIGGNDDRTNTPLGVHDVNISGTNQIYDFSYFLHMMSQELQDGLVRYTKLCKANESAYQEKMSSLLSHYDELNTLKNKLPDEGEESTDWKKFGLIELKEKYNSYWDKIKALLDSEDEKRKLYNTVRQKIEAEIKVREKEINNKLLEIDTVLSEISKLVVRLPEVIGKNLYAELNPFIREDTLTDDSFIVTNSMTECEILEMQQALLKHGYNELKKVCCPQFTLDIDLINFTVDYDYKRFTDSLDILNIIYINFEDRDSILPARLLKLHINWDDPSDFKATFSNRNSLKETWALFEEVQKQAEDVSSKIDYATGAWKNAAIVSVDVNKYMNNILDASNQQLRSNKNNEVIFGGFGIQCRKWLEEQNKFDPAQIWITNNVIAITQDDWNSVGLAIGYVKMENDYFFGVCADTLVGRAILGNQLLISNESGTYTIDKNGFLAKKNEYEVKINPDTPDNIFSISIDNKKLLYVDTSAKALTFEGKLISKSGQIASFDISNNTLISGNIGLCSDKTSGAVAFWAGNSNRNIAPFRVTNTGALTCSNAIITGGSLKIGSNFEVNSQGVLNAKAGNFSGNISASTITGGRIKGTTIEVGAFYADGNFVGLGDFVVFDSRRGQFSSSNGKVGMMSSAIGTGQAWLWAGANTDPYPFVVNGDGETRIEKIANTTHWSGYSLGGALDYIWSNGDDCGLLDLAERVNYLENHMSSE